MLPIGYFDPVRPAPLLPDPGTLDHYTICVEDGAAATAFHCDVLGFRFLRTQHLNTGTVPPGEIDMLNFVVGLPGDDTRVCVITEGLNDRTVFRRFVHVCAGAGQLGVLTRVRLSLGPCPTAVALTPVTYESAAALLRDLDVLWDTPSIDGLRAHFFPTEAGGWRARLEITRYHTDGDERGGLVLPSLAGQAGTETSLGWLEYLTREPPILRLEREIGPRPHPEISLLVPGNVAPTFVDATLAATPPTEVRGAILLCPIHHTVGQTPLLACQDGRAYLFVVLRTADPPTEARVDQLTQRNAALAVAARGAGVGRYLADSLTGLNAAADWRGHFGGAAAALTAARDTCDPARMLTPRVALDA